MTKEECEKALESLSNPPYESSCGGCICGVSDCGDCPNNKANKVLNQLIDEHFSNPPLTWEELKECNVVYDKKLKKYRLINELLEDGFIYFTYTTDTRIGEYYEPNRFYRKEVKE